MFKTLLARNASGVLGAAGLLLGGSAPSETVVIRPCGLPEGFWDVIRYRPFLEQSGASAESRRSGGTEGVAFGDAEPLGGPGCEWRQSACQCAVLPEIRLLERSVAVLSRHESPSKRALQGSDMPRRGPAASPHPPRSGLDPRKGRFGENRWG